MCVWHEGEDLTYFSRGEIRGKAREDLLCVCVCVFVCVCVKQVMHVCVFVRGTRGRASHILAGGGQGRG